MVNIVTTHILAYQQVSITAYHTPIVQFVFVIVYCISNTDCQVGSTVCKETVPGGAKTCQVESSCQVSCSSGQFCDAGDACQAGDNQCML